MLKRLGICQLFIFFYVKFLLGKKAAEDEIANRNNHDLAVERPGGDVVG